MTTLEELLTMMAEDAAKAVKPEKRPPPIPPKKSEAIGKEELESLDDGPVLKDGLWPSALPRPARRVPPPPPPGRRARGTAPLPADDATSGLIDVRAMAMAYAAEAARASTAEPAPAAEPEAAAGPAPAEVPIQLPVAEPPPASQPEATPRPVIAEGTKPIPAVEEEPAPAEPEKPEKPAAADPRRGLWQAVARRAAVVVALGGVAALAVTFVVNRVLSDGAASDPIDYTARVAPAAEPPAEPAAALPAAEAPAEPAIESTVIVQPTTITEVSGEPQAEPTPPAATDDIIDQPVAVETPQPAALRDEVAAEPAERPGRGAPPPELLADGCFDAACATTAPSARRPAPAPEAVITVPARLPTRPSNSEIASAIFAAHDQIEGCGDIYGTSGAVPLKIRIAASGAITKVAVGEGTTRFRTCVADIVRRLRMPASLIGTTASFPVLIR